LEEAIEYCNVTNSIDSKSTADQMKLNLKRQHLTAIFLLIGVTLICISAGIDFIAARIPDKIFPSRGLSEKIKLSSYFSEIKSSNGDADIYLFDSGKPGANVLLLGGTHPNEPAGFITAVTLIENIHVEAGKIFIIPQACLSGFAYTDPMEGCPQSFTIKTKSGDRKFRFGSRVSSPLDQWPDPLVYTQYPSNQKLSGIETRNLNRAYPGRPNGTFTEKVAYAIVQLIKKEKIDIAFDLHEAAPEIPIINAIVYHEKSEEIALNAVLMLEMKDLRYAPEKSPQNFRGLSHREWGDRTQTLPFLMETSNPIQGRLRGKTNEELIVDGVSDYYKKALESGKLRIEYSPEGEPLWKRTARHLEGFKVLLESYNEYHPEKIIVIKNIPSIEELHKNGLEGFLN
jgi:hypothetical protein